MHLQTPSHPHLQTLFSKGCMHLLFKQDLWIHINCLTLKALYFS